MGYGLPEHSEFLRALTSPSSDRGTLKTDEKGVPAEPGDYVYIPLPAGAPDTLIQLYEKPENYEGSELGEGTMVLLYNKDEYGPREIKWLDLDTFNAALEQTQQWVAEHNYGPEQATLDIETTRRSWSIGKLWQIALKMDTYRHSHNELPPPSLERLAEGYSGATDIFPDDLISPMSGREPLLRDKSWKVIGKGDYVLVPLPKSAPDGLIEIYERPEYYTGNALGDGTIVVISSQEEIEFENVKWMEIGVFKQKLAQTEKWLADNGFGPEWQKLVSWEANRIESGGNLRGIVISASTHEEESPENMASLDTLLSNRYIGMNDMMSPVRGRSLAQAKKDLDSLPLSEFSDYVYVTLPREAPGNLIQAYERPEHYNDSPWGKGTVVMFNSQVFVGGFSEEWMDIESFNAALKRTQQWLAEHKESQGEGE